MLYEFKSVLPEGVKVTILADRGFGDTKLYDFLKQDLGFDFVIRFRGNMFFNCFFELLKDHKNLEEILWII
ncbi:MAG: transposase [Gammaproteobacteria bacterium]|nr:transposase [Gammaproteobacteria bacterium]